MNFIKKTLKIFLKMSIISIVAIFALLFCMSMKSHGLKLYKNIPQEKVKVDPGFDILFDITKPSEIDMKIEILERDGYTFSWLFYAFEGLEKKDNNFIANAKSLFNVRKPSTLEEQADRSRILNLLDSIEKKERDITGSLQQRAIIVPVKFQIFLIDPTGEKLVWDDKMEYDENEKIGSKQNTGYGAYEIMVHFAGPILEPGTYHIIIKTLNDVPEFFGTKTGIRINRESSK